MKTTSKEVTQKRHVIDVCDKIEALKVLRNHMQYDMYMNNNVRDSKTKEELHLISQAIYNLDLLRTSLLSK